MGDGSWMSEGRLPYINRYVNGQRAENALNVLKSQSDIGYLDIRGL